MAVETYEKVKFEIENKSDCKLLSEVYTRAKDKLLLLCDCGNEFYKDYSTIKTYFFKKNKKLQCKKCSRKHLYDNSRLDCVEVRKNIYSKYEDYLFEWIYGEYINNMSKLVLVDKHGYIYESNYRLFMNSKPNITYNNPYAVYNLNIFLRKNNIEDIYIIKRDSEDNSMVWILCKEGHLNKISIRKLKSRRRCPDCSMESLKGDTSKLWNHNLTMEERIKRRTYNEYAFWRKSVFERDNYTCVCCGDSTGGNLVAHHKDGYNWCIERRTDVDNGATLCEYCHDYFHSIYGYGDNTECQFQEWIEYEVDM